ncbi:unnamed protein product [Gadus morhua 'NCC']
MSPRCSPATGGRRIRPPQACPASCELSRGEEYPEPPVLTSKGRRDARQAETGRSPAAVPHNPLLCDGNSRWRLSCLVEGSGPPRGVHITETNRAPPVSVINGLPDYFRTI